MTMTDRLRDYEQYLHHGLPVWVKRKLKGLHREFCLCWSCGLFHPGKTTNCARAAALYKLCQTYGLTTPVFECPRFELAEKPPEKDPNWPF